MRRRIELVLVPPVPCARPNPKPGILVVFRRDTVREIQLSEDWSKLAVALARP